MKKLLTILTFTFLVSTLQAQFFPVTVTKKNNRTIDSVTYYFNADFIQAVETISPVSVLYKDAAYSKATSTYRVTDNIDTLYKNANKLGANLIKLQVSTRISGTQSDTVRNWLFKISNIGEITSVTVSNQPRARSFAYVDIAGVYKPVYFTESASTIKSRVDSIAGATDNSTTRYDTSTYTLRPFDKHIILNSTTADTLTLLNPNQFVNKEPIVIANINTGAYFIGGGFTVKDKSGSNVTSIAANTVYTFKAYHTGSSYIWLKEY